ncbi:MAG: type II toxin-antitoxin system Phd/YefM family antitoxin [Gammaproteobacteria bacterium]|nr:type II toxin-antitoxin system Phd/YefM family antitoxin [Gammaproteobacteria bacterium]
MKASIVDLRYKTNDILKALDRNESVTILYHGKVKGIIKPVRERSELKIKDHPFFGMYNESEATVLEELENLRKPRHDL